MNTPAFRLQGLEKSFNGFRLGPLDLTIEPGSVVAFIGPNGAGKTTTLNCMMGLVKPDAGSVEICGQPNLPNQSGWKENVGHVGEVQGFFQNWTVDQNLHFLSKFYERWSNDRAKKLAKRIDLPLEKPFRQLSKGNRKKMAIVAALAYDPRVLLFDEPTSGLDPVVRSEVLDILWELLEDGETSILYSTHVLSDISRLADELVFLRDGNIILRSTKEDLLDQWRRFSFRFDGELPRGLAHAHHHRRSGSEHQLVSSEHRETGARLSQLGAVNIQESRLSIDEIAVEILKEKHRVAVGS